MNKVCIQTIQILQELKLVGPLKKIGEFGKDTNTVSCPCIVFSISGVK